ncbi:MAG: LPS-assembly protein [Candidatus Binataceae bacterium]|nr:LPS-assembly protein [Candidatus Binataceae bacterium]MEA2681233.1 LPS-assembly protein [Candidatus Binataceae bacterium]
MTGKNFVYDYKTDSFIVTGDAVITQAKTRLSADKIDLMRRDRKMHAEGNVHLRDPVGNIIATDAVVNLNDETSELTNATVTNHGETYRLEGRKVNKLLGQHYKVLDGFFTTCGCEPGTPDWSITAENMDVHIGDTGHARNAHFNILGYPVIPMPYAIFPADADRHSGLLAPRLGESGLRGFQMVQPYYWAINKSSDATVALDVETSKRIGMLGEYRLMSGLDDFLSVDGAFYNEDLRSASSRITDVVDNQIGDRHIPINRYDVIGMFRQHLTDNLVAYGDGMTVSDSLFLREMNVWTLSRTIGTGVMYPSGFTSMRNAESHFGLIDSYEDGFARLQGTWNQDLIQPQEFALQTLPDMLISGRKDLLGGLAYADYDVEGTNFWRYHGQSGLRLDLNPRLTLPWRLGDYVYGFGQLGLRETVYDTSGHSIMVTPVGQDGLQYNNGLTLGPLAAGGLKTREMIYGKVGIASEVEKVYDLHWGQIEKIKNTIEPFATYAYVPHVDQSDLPLYDETDRMESRSLLTYGFTSRVFAKIAAAPSQGPEGGVGEGEEDTTISPLRARTLSSTGSIEELFRFSLLQAYDVTHAIAPGASRFSDLDFSANVFPTRVWSFGSQLGYSPTERQLRYASAYLTFQPWWTRNQAKVYSGKAEEGSFLQMSYNYIGAGPSFTPGVNANKTQFLVARSYYELFDRMGVYFAPSYDFVARKLLSSAYGVRLKSPCDCWSFDMGITKTYNPSETQFQFQLTLGGIGSVGESPFGRNPFQRRTTLLPTTAPEQYQ